MQTKGTPLGIFFLALFALYLADSVLTPHVSYSVFNQTAKAASKYVNDAINKADIPLPTTTPSVLVIPGFKGDMATDRGIAASLKTVRDSIESYDTIVIVSGYYPEMCGEVTPLYPLVAYTGETVHTHLGNFTVDADLRNDFWDRTGGRPGMDYNYLVEQSDYFDHPFFWLRALFPAGKNPRTKVLPIILYATLRNQVQLAAQTLNDLLFHNENTTAGDNLDAYGRRTDGKRYLLIIPISVSSGVDLFKNVYIENILSDITMRSSVTEFEQWLYYLSGTTGATFSKTIASQILVVRLAALAAGLSDDASYSERSSTVADSPHWKWRMLDYYTSFDPIMNRSKMILKPYYHTYYANVDISGFTDDDNPTGHQIYYSMALSKEPPLHKIVKQDAKKKKRRVAKLPTPVTFTEGFSDAAIRYLMEHVRSALRGEKVNPMLSSGTKSTVPPELFQLAPYSLRVYILAEHSAEYEELRRFESKKNGGARAKGGSAPAKTLSNEHDIIETSLRDIYNHGELGDMCMETVLFELINSDFFPTESIYTSLIKQATNVYNERLSTSHINSLLKNLREKYKTLIAEGALPKTATKDINIDIKRSLVVEISIYHSWEYTNVFQLTDAKGHFIVLWDGRHAVCDVPENRPDGPPTIFFRLTQCALRNGLDPWDWQRGVLHTYDRTRYTANVYHRATKDEL